MQLINALFCNRICLKEQKHTNHENRNFKDMAGDRLLDWFRALYR